MQKRVRAIFAIVGLSAVALVGCDPDTNDTRIDPDGESIIDEDPDPDALITDPQGDTNQLDGNDDDREDPGQVAED